MMCYQPVRIRCKCSTFVNGVESEKLEYWMDDDMVIYRPFNGCDMANGSSVCQHCIASINRRILRKLDKPICFEDPIIID